MGGLNLRALTAPLLLDGATGTQLQRRGMPPGVCSEAWVLEHPEAMEDIQRRYAEAGSQAVYVPSFGANRLSLGRYGLGDQVRDFNLRLTELSRRATEGRLLLGGDISPTGLALSGTDQRLFEKLFENFREQAAVLEESGVDFFAVETQLSLSEARASVLAIREVSRKPVLVSFVIGDNGRTLCGGEPSAVLLAMEELGIDAFGFNCVGNLELLRDTLARIRPLTALPLAAKPNAGLPETRDGALHYAMSPETLAEAAEGFYRAGAGIFGGCCGTTEAHIAALRELLRGRSLTACSAPEGEYYASEYRRVDFAALREEDIAELPADEDYEDEILDLGEDVKLLRVEIRSREELGRVLDNQTQLKPPLWVRIGDEELRRAFRRGYHGKAKIDS